jgi:hypothetical protein
MCLELNSLLKGFPVQTPWSTSITVFRALTKFKTATEEFYGVLVEDTDNQNDCKLLWILERPNGFSTWQESRHRPLIREGESEDEIDNVFGHYEDLEGQVYYAVKWKDYECPTWELEEDLRDCQSTMDYTMQLLV